MKQFLRITAAVLAAAFLFALTGCSGGSGAASFTWFVDTIPANLDPQVVSAAPDVIACENLYGGLVRKNADGEIVPNLCESWTVSPDGRTYTFAIKDGLTYTAAEGLVPAGLTVDGIAYRGTAGDPMPVIPDPRALYLEARQGMASSDFSGVTILLPKEAGLTELAEQINGAWQKDCSLFFSVEEVPQEEFGKRLAAGDYTIALAPICAEGGSVYQMLQQFTAEGGGLTGYSDPLYTERLAESAQQTGRARCALLAECERQLLEGCTVVPLLGQQKRLLVADGIKGLVFDPFTPVLDLTYTTKN